MITLQIEGTGKTLDRLGAIPLKMRDALRRRLLSLSLSMEARVKEKLSGEVLHVRSGDLRSSIHSEVEENDTSIYGLVYSTGGRDKQPPYAAIHEFGGIISRESIKGKLYQIVIPQRAYLHPTLDEYRDQIVEELKAGAREGLQ